MNSVCLMGRVGNPVEVKQTSNGASYANISLALRRNVKAIDGHVPTDWITVQVWGKTAEFAAKYVRKGHRIGVVGSLQTREWKNQDGTMRRVVEVWGKDIHVVDWPESSEFARSGSGNMADSVAEPDMDTSLPFDI